MVCTRTIPATDADGNPFRLPLKALYRKPGRGVLFSGWEASWPGGQIAARHPTPAAALDEAEARWRRIEAIRCRRLQTQEAPVCAS